MIRNFLNDQKAHSICIIIENRNVNMFVPNVHLKYKSYNTTIYIENIEIGESKDRQLRKFKKLYMINQNLFIEYL